MKRRAGTWLLAAGAAVGAALGGWQVIDSGEATEAALAPDVVAVVDGRAIRRDDYERAVAAVAAERKEPLDDEARRRVLERLVDEELLVQRGLELDLAARDRRLRTQLSSAVIGLIRARAEQEVQDAGEQELRAFYEEHRDRFRQPSRVRIAQLFLRVDDGARDAAVRARAERLRARLEAGEPVAALQSATDRYDVAVPSDWMPLREVRSTLGATVTRGVVGLAPGEVTEPLRSGAGYHVVLLRERRDGEVPPFEQVRAEVRFQRRRVAAERALRRFLDERREQADIRIEEPVL